VDAAYILAGVAVVFLAAAGLRLAKGGAPAPQVRTWLLVAAIFGLVSLWLLLR
jgi:DMSO reductase anchor subunit